MRLRDQVVGGLNIFSSSSVPVLTLDQQRIAQALADVATLGILQQRSVHHSGLLAEQLQLALNSRIVIEQAKGALAHADSISTAEAFDRMRARARSTQTRLVVVAQEVLAGLERPGDGQ